MTTLQATVATFSPQTNSGTVLLDDGTQLSFDTNAFLRSGLRMLRLGQRVKVVVLDGKIEALTHIALPLR
jgi:2-phospho-L-lactate guanylyltransferase